MHKAAVLAALTALGAALAALAAGLPDTVETTAAVYARRGSLGANDYVATNVAPCKSAYRLVRVTDGRLRDRAVNMVTATNDVTLVTPQRRTVADYARAFCVTVAVGGSGGCRVTLQGASKVYRTGMFGGLDLDRGIHFLQFLEIGDNEYVVDIQELSENGGE